MKGFELIAIILLILPFVINSKIKFSNSASIQEKTLPESKQYKYCHCEGEGDITFVFEAGLGNWSIFFKPILDDLKKTTRVCLIDRMGYKDKIKNVPKDSKSIALHINKSLEEEGITDSIILVGHSFGGLNVRTFQTMFPEKVIGMVLLDATHPQLWDKIPSLKTAMALQINQMDKIIKIARLGMLKLNKKKIPTFGLPKELWKEYYNVTTKAQYYLTYKKEMEAFEGNLEYVKRLPNIGDLPLLVISSIKQGRSIGNVNQSINKNFTEKENDWIELQKDLAAISSNSKYIESQGDHFLQLSDKNTVLDELKKFYHLVKIYSK